MVLALSRHVETELFQYLPFADSLFFSLKICDN